MYNSDTELIFPLRVIPCLRTLRGEGWQALVDRVTAAQADPLDQQAFVLLMVRLGSCLTCDSDAYRAMRGCTQCARQMVRRYRGSDQDLLQQFEQMRSEVVAYQQRMARAHSDKEVNR